MAVTHRTGLRHDSRHDEEAGPRVVEPDTVEREGAGFDLQMRGYARDQVEQRIGEWATAYDALELERDQLLTELTELRGRPQQLTPLASMSARVVGIVESAEAEAADLLASAQRVADAIVADAREVADADLLAAAQERAYATDESDRMLLAARETADRLVLDAEAHANRAREMADTEAAETLRAANEEADRLRVLLAAEEEQVLAAARLEAAELERSTAHQRDIAEAEHARLLAAHASQQKQYAVQLRAELDDLQARKAEVDADLRRIRQVVGATPAPTATPQESAAEPLFARAAAAPAPSFLTAAETALVGDPGGPEPEPIGHFMHTGHTGEHVLDAAPPAAPTTVPSYVERSPEPLDVELYDDPQTEHTTALSTDAIRSLARRRAPASEPDTGELPRD